MSKSTGFTLIELVMMIVILSIIGVIITPKLFDNSIFQSRGFADQVLATLRYAQKTAIAQHQNVCVALTSTTVALTIDTNADTVCDAPLNLPDRQSLTAPTSVTLTTSATPLTFNALGQGTAAEIAISGVTAHIFVEAETGYVYQ